MRKISLLILWLGCGCATLHAQTKVDADQIIRTGRQYLGKPYSYGATGPDRFDCSGFVRFCFSQNGISLPRTSRDQAQQGTRVPKGWDNLQTGDLLFFGSSRVSHVAIYVGTPSANRHEFIHASSSLGITISALEERYWKSHFLFAQRLDLVASEPIVVQSENSAASGAAASQSEVGAGISQEQEAIDNVVPPTSRRWKIRVKRKNRQKVVWANL